MGITGDAKKLLPAPELEQAKGRLITLINDSDSINNINKCLKIMEL